MLRYLRRITLITSDICGLILAAGVTYLFMDHDFFAASLYQSLQIFGIFVFTSIICLMIFANRGHYSWKTPWWEQVRHVVTICTFAAMIDVLINYVAVPILPAQPHIVTTWFLSVLFILGARLMGRKFLKSMDHWNIKTVVIGKTQSVIDTIIALKSEFFLTYDIKYVVLIDEDYKSFQDFFPDIKPFNDLQETESHSMVIFCIDEQEQGKIAHYISKIRSIGAKYAIVPPNSGFSLYGLQPQYFFGYNIVLMEPQNKLKTFWGRLLKMIMDRGMALLALVMLAPVFAVLYIVVKKDGGPAFYFQNRLGKNGKMFKCWKFRSMITNADVVLKEILENDADAREEYARDFKLKNDPRITKIGHFLRKSSLDEIPQLYNVLRGEMSIVGPRPIVQAEEGFYGDKFEYYLSVRPGITGLWQVSGRNDVSYEQRVALDTWYVENWSIWNDLVIIFKTTFVVLYRKGAY